MGDVAVIEKTRRAWIILSLAGSAALLPACTTLPVVNSPLEMERLWSAQQVSVDLLQAWTVSGRLGLQSDREGWHVAFRWRQLTGSYQIALSAPLGQQSAELQGDEQGVTLQYADGRRATAADAEQLILRQLGWRVPIKGLHYWVRGLPLPDAAERHGLDNRGRLLWLKQAGWDISYRRYGDFSGKTLPTKIYLDNDKFKVRVVIDTWILS